jgi:hypothetical protein
MFRQSSTVVIRAMLFAGLVSLLFAARAKAGVGLAAETLGSLWRVPRPVERIQYYVLGGDDYCWYPDGWEGPGWYQCGYEWNYGLGWGGPYGWNGWGGGVHVRRHGRDRIGIWRPGRPDVPAGAPSHPIQNAPRAPKKPDRDGMSGYVHVPALRDLSNGAEFGSLSRDVWRHAGMPGGRHALPGSVDFPDLEDLSDGAALGRVGPGLEIERAQPRGHEALPSVDAIPVLPRLPHDAAPRPNDLGAVAGVTGFHPSGGFSGSGFRAATEFGGFSGFHPGGGGMFVGGHVGGIGHR